MILVSQLPAQKYIFGAGHLSQIKTNKIKFYYDALKSPILNSFLVWFGFWFCLVWFGWSSSLSDFLVSSMQTVAVWSFSSSFAISLQQLAHTMTRQQMVKRMEKHMRAMSVPEQPLPEQRYRKAPFASEAEVLLRPDLVWYK